MGEWGVGPFDNDDAADWIDKLEEAPAISTVRRALDIATMRYVEVREASVAVAAAQIVAAALGHPGPALPTRAAAWVKEHSTIVTDQDQTLAIAAVDRVLGDYSELRALWAESPDAGWNDQMQELRHRLRRPPTPQC